MTGLPIAQSMSAKVKLFNNESTKGDVMKRALHALLLLSMLSLFGLTACSKNDPLSADRDNSEEGLNVNAENGGFTTSDEAPAFGDADVASESAEDADVMDAISNDPAAISALNSGSVKVYLVRITFGLLQGDSTATEIVDWSGSAEINKGTLLLMKTIRFEGNDYIHLPRDNRRVLEFTSQTRPHYDGLLLTIIDNDTTQPALEGTLNFIAGAYSRTFTFSELDSLDLLEPVGENGHEVSIISRSNEIVPFNGGFLAGRWVKKTANDGIFFGRWINSPGTNAGHLRGIWGVNRAGEKVFFGKYISLNGEFRGLLRGTWGFGRSVDGGFFRGHWISRNNQNEGSLHGHWRSGRPGDGRGYFHGRYHEAQGSSN
jgi:hypothetical protein